MMPVLRELLRYAVYDREPITQQITHLFSRPAGTVGISGRIKSFTDTNLYQSQMFDAPHSFLVDSVQAVLFSRVDHAAGGDAIPPLRHPFWWTTTAALYIGRKEYWRSPLAFCASPLLLAGENYSELDKEERAALESTFLPRLTLPDGDAPHIREQEPFEVVIEVSDVTYIPANCSVEVALLGRLYRGLY